MTMPPLTLRPVIRNRESCKWCHDKPELTMLFNGIDEFDYTARSGTSHKHIKRRKLFELHQ